jgi:hypothetical protein
MVKLKKTVIFFFFYNHTFYINHRYLFSLC